MKYYYQKQDEDNQIVLYMLSLFKTWRKMCQVILPIRKAWWVYRLCRWWSDCYGRLGTLVQWSDKINRYKKKRKWKYQDSWKNRIVVGKINSFQFNASKEVQSGIGNTYLERHSKNIYLNTMQEIVAWMLCPRLKDHADINTQL